MESRPRPAHASSSLELAREARLRRTGELVLDLVRFVALLREVGVPVPIPATMDALRALDQVALTVRDDVHTALFSTLVASAEEGGLFDLVFDTFWSAEPPALFRAPDEAGADAVPGADEDSADAWGTQLGARRREEGEEQARRASYSSSGRRRAQVGPLGADLDVLGLARRLVRALASSQSRRMRSGSTGDLIDLRESLRRNLPAGGELLELARLRPDRQRARIAVLCDVSSSMAPFTPLFLTFVHALTRIASPIEAAIFNVELCSVTDVFRRRPLPEALDWLTDRSVALAGGTKTGHCLHAFNQSLAARGLTGPSATAIILSDGWDVGDSELLDEQARRLRGQVGRIIWLDPHAAATDFRPQVRGLKLALDYVDDYLDFSAPGSLDGLVEQIEARRGVVR